MEKRHRVNVYLSEEEYELLKNRQNESGKSQSEVLKEKKMKITESLQHFLKIRKKPIRKNRISIRNCQ